MLVTNEVIGNLTALPRNHLEGIENEVKLRLPCVYPIGMISAGISAGINVTQKAVMRMVKILTYLSWLDPKRLQVDPNYGQSKTSTKVD